MTFRQAPLAALRRHRSLPRNDVHRRRSQTLPRFFPLRSRTLLLRLAVSLRSAPYPEAKSSGFFHRKPDRGPWAEYSSHLPTTPCAMDALPVAKVPVPCQRVQNGPTPLRVKKRRELPNELE
jgi:hypothetical protein